MALGLQVSVLDQLALKFLSCGEAEHHSSLETIAEQVADLIMARNETHRGSDT